MPKKPQTVLEGMSQGAVTNDLKGGVAAARMHPDRNPFLGVAKVINVNYEENTVSLKVLLGSEDDFDRVSVPVVYPGAGSRHFLGSMPTIGDYCVVGWMAQDTTGGMGGTKQPVILGWFIPGTWPGREWLTTSEFTVDEYDLSTPKKREVVRGALDRRRHKARHMQPGTILASSAQGADLVLDEGVTLANRRGNEIRLRDQDQMVIFRSLGQHHAMGGARIYAGPAQRDATFLAPTMVSDGFQWDGPLQSIGGEPIHELELPTSLDPEGFLTPAAILSRNVTSEEGGLLGSSVFPLSPRLDPYTFLRQGGIIDESGFVVDDKYESDAFYGGKSMFRVSARGAGNAIVDPNVPSLTEWRLEVTHTNDGKLPVTEQTDLFDAERLPRSDAKLNDPFGSNPNVPFIECVYGSVIGNDPFTPQGRESYGVPLVAKVFEGDTPDPKLEPARLVQDPRSQANPTPIEEQAATLFRLRPIKDGEPTFWSVNKRGQVRAYLGGPESENSLEAALAGGLKLSVGGTFELQLTSGFKFGSKGGDAANNIGVELGSEKGAVRIYGGGSVRGVERMGERLNGAGEAPSVDIQAETNARLAASRKALVRAGQQVELNAPSVKVNAVQEAEISSSDRVGINSKVVDITSGGKMTESFGGPKDLLPTNGPLHVQTYSPTIPGVAKQTTFTLGDREEEFYLGNHSTLMRVGDISFTTNLGSFSATAGVNSMELGMDSFQVQVNTPGGVSLQATAGPASLTGTTSVTVESLGPATVRGSTVLLGAPVDNNAGPIICAGTLEPFTGLPYLTWGLGAKNHIVGT